MRAWIMVLAVPAVLGAAENCPWLNAASAGGVLGGEVTTSTMTRGKAGEDGSCSFIRKDGDKVRELSIEVVTMQSATADFSAYKARCHSAASPVNAIGNEAFSCTDGTAELVVGRVRDKAFVVRMNSHSASTPALRDKTRNIAEQVAGILF